MQGKRLPSLKSEALQATEPPFTKYSEGFARKPHQSVFCEASACIAYIDGIRCAGGDPGQGGEKAPAACPPFP
jgi:hypothetical protein